MSHQPRDRDTLKAAIELIAEAEANWMQKVDTDGSMVAAGYRMGLLKAWRILIEMRNGTL